VRNSILHVNPVFTVRVRLGWTPEACRPLLETLYRHAVRPAFTCGFRWQAGSIVFPGQSLRLAPATHDHPGQRRRVHRITVGGVPPALTSVLTA